ncbi:MAG: DUF362 domain-containing protein [Candidatus Latescibacterota bacterium]
MSKCARKHISWGLVGVGLVLMVVLDMAKSPEEHTGAGYGIVDAVSAATKPDQSVVGVIRSDFAQLGEPASPDSALTEAQVEAMVRYAITEAGGLHTIIEPGTDWVVLKANVVELKPSGSGVITDVRVIKALVKIVHAIAPEARITIAEGNGEWITADHADIQARIPQSNLGDGFEVAGYRALLKDEALAGIQLDIVDLNFDEAIEVSVPDQWYAREKYFIPATVLECDVLISVPVLKIHDGVGMTNAMKNFVGIAPGMIYGWSKNMGFPPGSGNPGLAHTPAILDETIVDLTSLSGVDFVVVDALMCMERRKTDEYGGGRPVRMNMIVASADIVAADAVSARLIGFNPDDIEYLTLAATKGLGKSDMAYIKVNGNTIDQVARRFEKCPVGTGKWGEQGHYGQGARTWVLSGPFGISEKESMLPDPQALQVVPDQDGWSKPVYFHDDRIDLDTYYKDPVNCLVYAYTEFVAPRSQTAELWIGSGEDLKVWINGSEVYDYQGVRRHKLPNDRKELPVTEGRNTLLVQAKQSRGGFDFSVNICEPETDPRYDGNRVMGLKFDIPETQAETASVDVKEVVTFQINEWLNVGDRDDRSDWGTWTALTTEDGLSGNQVRSIAFDKGGLPWVLAGGLCTFDGEGWRAFEADESFSMWGIRDLAVDLEGGAWIASRDGLSRYDGKKGIPHLDGSTGFVTVDHLGRVWSSVWTRDWDSAKGKGVTVYDGKGWKTYTESDGLSSNNVTDLAEDASGTIWMATRGGGVNRFDGETWTHYTTEEGLLSNQVNLIATDPAGTIWIATDGNGVSRFDGETWSHFGEQDGLPGLDVQALMADSEGFAWVATRNNGLSRFDGREWVSGIGSEGVRSIVQGPDGRIWFGTDGAGLSVLRARREK